ncbi:fra a 1-associated protein [Impatiens glandulifera]|uniref:fra a 1-associated protein n=1 Tax=Impatiens glandulifera TaxID=253017 RepID=UPI001FB185BA|nr:fra a 1-associated protein [Impatiens glandulifera]
MGWVWKDEDKDETSSAADDFVAGTPRSRDLCGTRKIVKSQCKTEEVEPGKYIRKCEKTEDILRDCVGRPAEVIQSNKEYTEEDVSEQMRKGEGGRGFPFHSSEMKPFDFPGVRSDIEAIQRGLFWGIGGFIEAAEELKNEFFNAFDSIPMYKEGDNNKPSSSSPYPPVVQRPPPIGKEEEETPYKSGDVDLSSLARDV